MEKKTNLILFLIILIAFFTIDRIHAQEVDMQNLAALDVDQLTDDQIRRFIAQVESAGYSESQLLIMARARGMSELQIEKLRTRITQVQSGTSTKSETGRVYSEGRMRQKPDLRPKSKSDPFDTILPEDTLVDEDELQIFGLAFFQQENASFEPSLNVATPKNYVLGPGDEIIIDIWGSSEYTYQQTISTEGALKIPGIGPIYLNGLTIEEASDRIKGKLRSIYSTLGQNTFAEVNLGQIRTINVNVVGEVNTPGSYTVSSFATAFNALYLAGGPGEGGSFRRIGIFRNGQQIAVLDAYDYLIRGKGSNITLHDQDVVLVYPYENRVSIYGEVKRPAIYEMLADETFTDLIEYSGGFTGKAYYDRITLRRNQGNFRAVTTVERGDFDKLRIQNGDDVEVRPITNLYTNRVMIDGAVFQPGEYELKDSLSLQHLIRQAGGLRGDAFLQRAVILRQNDDFSLSNLAVNLKAVMEGSAEVWLEKEDLVKIQSIYDLREAYFIQIKGEVLKPGSYPYVQGQTVEDLIFLAGGFKESAARSFVEVARRFKDTGEAEDPDQTAEIYNFSISKSLTLDEEASQFELHPYDLVVIRKSPFYEDQLTVELEGEALYPGTYVLSRKNERISDVVRRAGGLTRHGYAKGATLIRRTEYYEEPDEKKSVPSPGQTEKTVQTENELQELETDLAQFRREELKSLLERDTSMLDQSAMDFKQQESIGIDLEEIMKRPGSETDLILKHGDILSIPRKLETVRVRGEVLYPSNVIFRRFSTFRGFISLAGGFTDEAKKSKAYVVYPNGSAKKTRSFLGIKIFPKVEPGSEIIVPQKPERRRLSPGEVISLASGLGTLALVINNLTK